MRATMLIVVGALACSATAHADPMIAAPGVTPVIEAPEPRWDLTLGGGLRITEADSGSDGFQEQLANYGYAGKPAVLHGLAGDLGYRLQPKLEVGGAVAWLTAAQAEGAQFQGDTPLLTSTTIQVGGFARWRFTPRSEWASFEPRGELGVMRTRLRMRGEDLDRLQPYLRAGADLRLGGPGAGVLLSAGLVWASTPSDDQLAPPMGGVDLGLSIYLRR